MGMCPEKQIFLLWRQIKFITRSCGTSERISIDFEKGEIVLEKTGDADIDKFEELVYSQKAKHAHYDYLRKLKVDLGEICAAMERDDMSGECYFDSVTGDIIYIPLEFDEDNVFDDKYIEDLPEWEKEMVDDVRAIYEDDGGRYHFIPNRRGPDAYEIMIEFAETVENAKISDELFRALNGKGAFRRFKDVLHRHPKIRERWFAFKDEREKEEAREWMYSIGIDPVDIEDVVK